jgi:hypothetical protein
MAITASLLGESEAPVHAMVKGGGTPFFAIVTATMSNSYPTGGETLTLPADIRVGDLVGVSIINPIPAVGTDRIYLWNGSTSTPKIGAKVISTAAEVANTTDLSADTLTIRLDYVR